MISLYISIAFLLYAKKVLILDYMIMAAFSIVKRLFKVA
jgi:hypothetical protein